MNTKKHLANLADQTKEIEDKAKQIYNEEGFQRCMFYILVVFLELLENLITKVVSVTFLRWINVFKDSSDFLKLVRLVSVILGAMTIISISRDSSYLIDLSSWVSSPALRSLLYSIIESTILGSFIGSFFALSEVRRLFERYERFDKKRDLNNSVKNSLDNIEVGYTKADNNLQDLSKEGYSERDIRSSVREHLTEYDNKIHLRCYEIYTYIELEENGEISEDQKVDLVEYVFKREFKGKEEKLSQLYTGYYYTFKVDEPHSSKKKFIEDGSSISEGEFIKHLSAEMQENIDGMKDKLEELINTADLYKTSVFKRLVGDQIDNLSVETERSTTFGIMSNHILKSGDSGREGISKNDLVEFSQFGQENIYSEISEVNHNFVFGLVIVNDLVTEKTFRNEVIQPVIEKRRKENEDSDDVEENEYNIDVLVLDPSSHTSLGDYSPVEELGVKVSEIINSQTKTFYNLENLDSDSLMETISLDSILALLPPTFFSAQNRQLDKYFVENYDQMYECEDYVINSYMDWCDIDPDLILQQIDMDTIELSEEEVKTQVTSFQEGIKEYSMY